jgi:hypothetical protein
LRGGGKKDYDDESEARMDHAMCVLNSVNEWCLCCYLSFYLKRGEEKKRRLRIAAALCFWFRGVSDLMRVEEQEPALPLLCASAAAPAPAYAPGNLGACRHAAS